MFSKLKKWLTTKPATKAAWFGVFIGIVGLIISLLLNSYAIYQNTQAIKSSQESVRIAQESLFSSISPSMNIKFPRAWEEQIIQIQNTSPYRLNNIDVFLVEYKIEKEEIVNRSQASIPLRHHESLEQKQVSTLQSPYIFNSVEYPQNSDNGFYSFVIVSHREVDNKRFVHVEPFGAAWSENQIDFFPMYSGKGTAFGGPPKRLTKILSEVEKVEMKLFRYDER